jgi:hypothetical protein
MRRVRRREFLRSLVFFLLGTGITPDVLAQDSRISNSTLSEKFDDHLKDYLYKMRFFDTPHKDDIRIDTINYSVFRSTVLRLRRLQEYVGHGNFQILSFDDGVSIAKNSSMVGRFSADEMNFMEMIFYAEASRYGFFGSKPLKKITARIPKKEVIKIPGTGNYLFKGKPHQTYLEIKRQLGNRVVLTSGVRGVMKQFLLFLNKAYRHNGNLSLASRSLAPPGYSYHGVGDFDVGQAGFGSANFTERFTTTEVYRRLSKLGYLRLRYPQNNLLGVRFEPWHVKMCSDEV